MKKSRINIESVSVGVLAATLVALLGWLYVSVTRLSETTKPAPVPNITKDPRDSIIRLVRGGHTYCSGTVIDKNTAITASHCVSIQTPFGAMVDTDTIEIRAADNKPIKITAKVKGVSYQLDRAILKGNFSVFPASKYAGSAADSAKHRNLGEKFLSCGFPMGQELYCNVTTYISNIGFMLALKGILIPGMSGGPTFTSDGTLIAVNVAVEGEMAIVAPIYGIDGQK
jgi:V8-like Glu-specific endopeptidase